MVPLSNLTHNSCWRLAPYHKCVGSLGNTMPCGWESVEARGSYSKAKSLPDRVEGCGMGMALQANLGLSPRTGNLWWKGCAQCGKHHACPRSKNWHNKPPKALYIWPEFLAEGSVSAFRVVAVGWSGRVHGSFCIQSKHSGTSSMWWWLANKIALLILMMIGIFFVITNTAVSVLLLLFWWRSPVIVMHQMAKEAASSERDRPNRKSDNHQASVGFEWSKKQPITIIGVHFLLIVVKRQMEAWPLQKWQNTSIYSNAKAMMKKVVLCSNYFFTILVLSDILLLSFLPWVLGLPFTGIGALVTVTHSCSTSIITRATGLSKLNRP